MQGDESTRSGSASTDRMELHAGVSMLRERLLQRPLIFNRERSVMGCYLGTRKEFLDVIALPDNRVPCLFPEKIGGHYVRLDRPIGHGIGSIWVSFSPDLMHWGDSQLVIAPRPGYWDSYRVGASCVPIETNEGWLEIYHGTKMTSAGPIYRTGVVMLDLEDPSVVIGRSDVPIHAPRADYERIGDINNVVFASGAIVEDDGTVKVYYGAADTSICLATGNLADLIDVALEGSNRSRLG